MPASPRRVVAIGLDAAEWTLIDSMSTAGEVPRLAALQARAAVARLHHTDDGSGRVWEHFLRSRGGSTSGQAFFAGVDGRTICFDVPCLSLRDVRDDTVAVTAWGARSPRVSQPPGLLGQIEKHFGAHPALENDAELVWREADAVETFVHAHVSGTRRRAEIACWLMDQFPDWHLYVTVMSELRSAADQLSHRTAPVQSGSSVVDPPVADECLRAVYRAVDASVGLLVDALPPETTVVVFSMAVHTSEGFAFVIGPGVEPGPLGDHDALAVTATVAALAGAETDGLDAQPLPVVPDA